MRSCHRNSSIFCHVRAHPDPSAGPPPCVGREEDAERRRRFQFCIERFQSIGRLFLQLPKTEIWSFSRLVSRSRARPAARPRTRCCGFEASEAIPFAGADSILSSGCGAISGRLRFAVQSSRASIARPKRAGSKDCRAARGLGFFSHLGILEPLRADDFQSRRNAIPSSAQPPARRRLAARERARAVARGLSQRSERCRRWSCVGSTTRRGDGSIRRPSMSSFYQKDKSRKIAAGCSERIRRRTDNSLTENFCNKKVHCHRNLSP